MQASGQKWQEGVGVALTPYAYLVDLFTRLANGHLHKDIDTLMPWAYVPAAKPETASDLEK